MSNKHHLPSLEPIVLEGYTLDLNGIFHKEYTDIGEAAIELPAVIEWLNFQAQGQIEQKHRVKAALARAEATAYFALRNGDFQRMGYGEKATDKGVDHAVNLDESVTALNEQLAVITGWVERLSSLQRSLQSKLELVRSSEATRRTLTQNI